MFEVGMGGRLDATNILSPSVTAVTHIDVDHQEFLGDNLLQIAGEKLGILKRGVPLVMAEPPDKQVRDLAVWRCEELDIPYTLVSPGMARSVRIRDGKPCYEYLGAHFTLPFSGRHQIENAMVATEVLRCIGVGEPTEISQGFSKAWLPGRFQEVEVGERTVIFDVAHNRGACETLVEALDQKFPGDRACFVVGIMKDKDYGPMVRCLSRKASRFIFARPKTPRAEDPKALARCLGSGWDGECEVVDDVGSAVVAALERGDTTVCVTGSFYTVGEAMQAAGISPYGNLPTVPCASEPN